MSELRFLAVTTLAGILCFGAVGLAWWLLLEPAPPPGWTEIVIAPGTSDRLERGDAVSLPAAVELDAGDGLRIVNNDSVAHRLGGTVVLPGETVEVDTAGRASGELVCSFVPGGSLGLTIEGRGGLMATVAIPALALGLPLGFLTGVAVRVARRLDFGDSHDVL